MVTYILPVLEVMAISGHGYFNGKFNNSWGDFE
jgi:hypothetical protein